MKLRETFIERNPWGGNDMLQLFPLVHVRNIVLEVYNLFHVSNLWLLEIVCPIGQWSGQSTALN